jgi:hypothetical protein
VAVHPYRVVAEGTALLIIEELSQFLLILRLMLKFTSKLQYSHILKSMSEQNSQYVESLPSISSLALVGGGCMIIAPCSRTLKKNDEETYSRRSEY